MAWHQRHRLRLLRARLALLTATPVRRRRSLAAVADDAAQRGAARYEYLARATVGLADRSIPRRRTGRRRRRARPVRGARRMAARRRPGRITGVCGVARRSANGWRPPSSRAPAHAGADESATRLRRARSSPPTARSGPGSSGRGGGAASPSRVTACSVDGVALGGREPGDERRVLGHAEPPGDEIAGGQLRERRRGPVRRGPRARPLRRPHGSHRRVASRGMASACSAAYHGSGFHPRSASAASTAALTGWSSSSA